MCGKNFVAARLIGERPIVQALNGRQQGAAEFGERIFHFGRHGAVIVAVNQAGGFKLAQLQREHAPAGVGHQPLQFVEAARRVRQVVDNQHFPFTADDVEGGVDGAIGGGLHRYAFGKNAFGKKGQRCDKHRE